jgi:hypothetical protein
MKKTIMKQKQTTVAQLKIFILTLIVIFINPNLLSKDQIVQLNNGKKVVLHDDKTWEYHKELTYNFNFSDLKDNTIPKFLRKGISVNKSTLTIAVKLYLQGWRYVMPSPKSKQASWGNHDGRTTWWKGYWYNNKTNKYSKTTPQVQSNGYYYGDHQNEKGYWRRGGSPSTPTKINWLLSSYGGIKPV